MATLRAPGGWLVAVGLLVAGLGTAPGALAEGEAGTIHLRPATVMVAMGEMATVEIWLEGGAGYYGVELRLVWDPALVSLPAGQVTPLWEVLDAERHVIVRNLAGWCDDRSGNIWYGAWYVVANVSPAVPFSGSGRICAIDLVGLAPGTAPLRITYAAGGTNTGGSLAPGTGSAAMVVVIEGAAATRTPTATAMARPTPSATATVTIVATATHSATLRPRTLVVTVAPEGAVAIATVQPERAALPAVEPTAQAQQVQVPSGCPTLGRLLLAFVGGALGGGGLLWVLRRRR